MMEEDVSEVLLAELGEASLYQSKGAGPSLPTRARVTAAVPTVTKPEVLQSVGQGRSHKSHRFNLMIAMATTAELTGPNPPAPGTVSASGGVVQLIPGDVVHVPGRAVGRPKSGPVALTVQEGTVDPMIGYWKCEAVL